jgi:integrase
MTVYFDKARRCWRYDFELGKVRYAKECLDQDGKPVTSRRGALVAEAEAKRRAAIAPKLPRSADLTVAQVMDRLTNDWMGEADWPNKLRYCREIIAFFGAATLVRDIDGARCDDYITFARKQPVMIWTGGSSRRRDAADADQFWKPHPTGKCRGPGTVNRYLPVIRAMFERAHKTRDPITGQRAIEEVPEVKDLSEPKRLPRPVPDAVLSDVLGTVPSHIADAMLGTLYFGFRKTEMFSLQIGHVDFEAGGIRLEHQEVKNNKDEFMPGGRDAMQFLARLVDQARERGVTHLITWRRTYKDAAAQAAAPWRPIKSPKRAWGTAMTRIEKAFGKRWRWHDIRAAFITHVAITSGGIVAKHLARHADYRTTEGYIAVADDVARAAAERASERPALGLVKGGKR